MKTAVCPKRQSAAAAVLQWTRRRCGIVIIVSWVCGVVAAQAAEPIQRIPADVCVLVRLKAPEATVEKTTAFANRVMPGTGQMVQQSAAAVGVAISNPTLAGVDRKRDWWVAVWLYADRDPDVLFAIPTTDPEALKEALGQGFQVEIDDGWAYYSEQPDALKRLRTETATASAAALLKDAVRSTFDGGDLSVLVNAPQVVRVYDAKLRDAQRQVEQSIDETLEKAEQPDAESPERREIPPELRKNLPALLAVARDAVRQVFQTVREMDAIVCAVAVDADGLRLDDLVTFRSGSRAADFLTALADRPVDLSTFDRLPAGKLVYGGWFVGLSEVYDWALQFAEAVAPNADAKQTVGQLKDALGELKLRSYVGAGWLGDLESGLLRSATVLRSGNPADLPDTVRRLVRTGTGLGALISSAYSPGQRTELKFEPEAEDYDGVKADVLRGRFEVDEQTDPLGITKAILSAMYGPDGMVVRLVYLGDSVIQVMGTREDVREVVQAYRTAQRSDEPEFVRMRKRLPERPAFVGMIDLASLLVQGAKIAVGSGKLPIPITPEMLQGLRVEPSYVAIGGAIEPRSARLRLVVPVEQVRGWVHIGMFARQVFLQLRNAPQPRAVPPDGPERR